MSICAATGTATVNDNRNIAPIFSAFIFCSFFFEAGHYQKNRNAKAGPLKLMSSSIPPLLFV